MRLLRLALPPLLLALASPVVFGQQAAPPGQSAQPQSALRTRKRPAPPPPPAATDQRQFISYWTTETGWRTELQLRNNQVGQTLTVTPVLRTVDGAETPLSPVVVQPQEVKTVDVAAAIGSSAPQLIGTHGSLALRYSAPSQINLYAVSMVMGVGHSVAFHIDATGEDQSENVGSREGIWWLPNNTANDYLILTNQGQNPLDLVLSLFDASGKPAVQNLRIPPRGMNRLSIRQLVSAAKLSGSYGGIKAAATTHAGSLDTLHVLFDENAGFSAVMRMFFYDPRAQLKERDYAATGKWTLRAPMLALPNPDPALAFPVDTSLHPRLLVHNNIAKPTDASLLFNWHSDSANGQVAPTALHLGAFETRLIDVTSLQGFKGVPTDAHWASVILTTNGLPDEVSAVAASFDESLKYGAQTPFSDQLAVQWEGGQWQYDPQHDSIITAGNGSAKPTQTAFTIFYNQGTQKYELDQTLQPGEQMWIDIGKLIRESVPDKNGKTLPADLTSGSYDVRDLGKLPTLFEGKVIYDKTYGHVTYGCAACCGYATTPGDTILWYDPIGVLFGGTEGDGVLSWYPCDSQYDDVSTSFFGGWSSQYISIAGVDYYGTVSGAGVGSTVVSTGGSIPSNNAHMNCPFFNPNPGGGANVCSIPSTENTAVHGTEAGNGPEGATMTDFVQTIFDSAGDNFSGLTVQEGNAAPGQDTCWFQGSANARVTGVTGGPWTVAGGQVSGQPNAWGFDAVGWFSSAVTYYRAQDPAHGIAIPCGFTVYQSLQISCSAAQSFTYTPSYGNKLTTTIEQTDVVNCRNDMNNSACQTITF